MGVKQSEKESDIKRQQKLIKAEVVLGFPPESRAGLGIAKVTAQCAAEQTCSPTSFN